MSATWTDRLLDHLVEQLAVHPRVQALIQMRVDQSLAERGLPARTWLTLSEAAEQLGCTPDAVRMRIKRGRLEHRHHGRRLYVSAASVERLARAA
jgi:excisionase family DNA binding protein